MFLAFPVLNLLLLVSPAIVAAKPGAAPWFAVLFAASGTLPLVLPHHLTGDVFVGFYLWVASFFAMAAGYLSAAVAEAVGPVDPTLGGRVE